MKKIVYVAPQTETLELNLNELLETVHSSGTDGDPDSREVNRSWNDEED
ncbi:MAG: hypothetical protein IJ243_03975 [Prevotella sp.]|nr:hypothetical protein [Prevotella sp.]